jgi:CRISPR-associated protein (TIGR02710 family)
MTTERIKTMIVSVGGTPAPIIVTLNKSHPDYVCFFVSGATKRMIEAEILPILRFKPLHHDWVVTPDPESLSECYSVVANKVPAILEKWEVDAKNVCVDYTGGTKTMSVALALATIDKSCCYSYVGGEERSKGGTGEVVSGRERLRFLENPWDEVAQMERKEVSILFNKARYATAADTLEKCIGRVSSEKKPLYKALHAMVTGYDLWDRFRHRDAAKFLQKSRDILTTFAHGTGKKEDRSLVKSLGKNIEFLDRLLAGSKPSILQFRDLLANARRRADTGQFDDGVARLYRAMEALAQVQLKEQYGIATSNVKPESLPEKLREEFVLKYRPNNDFKIKLPLYASYLLLSELGDKLGKHFLDVYDEKIKSLLGMRNGSILAHGFIPVGREVFQDLFGLMLDFSGMTEEDLPRFPDMQL